MSYMDTDLEGNLTELAHRTLDLRLQAGAFQWTPELSEAIDTLNDGFVSVTEDEALAFDADWDPEAAMSSDDVIHQRDVLECAISQAVGEAADVLVFLVWDGVPHRMALAAQRSLDMGEADADPEGHWGDTEVDPCIGEFPAMTMWGHLRLMHGVGLESGLEAALSIDEHASYKPLCSYWIGVGGELEQGWDEDARDHLIDQTAEKLAPFLTQTDVSYGGYTGHTLTPIETNVLHTLTSAMEANGAVVTQRGERGERGQLRRIRELVDLDVSGEGKTLIFARISFDSRGSGDEDQRHLALNFGGHAYGPFNPAAVSGLRRSWDEVCEVVRRSLAGRKALIVGCSDHGMTPVPNDLKSTWANLAENQAGVSLAHPRDGRTWFSERGAAGPSGIVDVMNTLVMQTTANACSIDSAGIPRSGLTAMSLRHGWSFNQSHRGDHGGIGFDDLVIPYMRRIIE